MNMRATKTAVAAAMALGTLCLALAPATAKADHRRGRLIGTLHALEAKAVHFHDLVHHRTGVSHLDADAHRIERAVRHLHYTAERRASYQHLLRDFDAVRCAVRHMDHELIRAHRLHHDPHVMRDWYRLKSLVSSIAYQLGTTPRVSPTRGDHHGDFGRGNNHRGRYDRHYGGGSSVRIGRFTFRF